MNQHLKSGVVVLCEEYNVVITTEPASGPFLVGREIKFTCYVDPAPPEPVTFSWHAVKAYGTTTLRSWSSVNTISYLPQYRDLHISWFFCKVFSNGTQVGVGRKSLEIHGFVFTEELPVRSFNFGGTISLQINISNNSLARYIRTFTWYHNGTEVTNSSRVTIQNNSSKLVVRNAVSDDAGTYRVEVTSLNFNDYSCCDATWLYFLRNHAAYAPVTFTLTYIGELGLMTCDHDFEELFTQYYPLVIGDSSILLSIQDNETLPNDSTLRSVVMYILRYSYYVRARLSVNGTRLSSNQRKFNLTNTITGSNLLRNEIDFQYNSSDEGFYIHLLYTYYFDIEDGLDYNRCRCRGYSSHARGHLSILYLSFPVIYFNLKTYKPPLVNIISSHHNTEFETDVEMLVCSAYGGIPDKHNITLGYSGQQGVSVSGNNLQILLNRFGEYVCTVDSLYDTTTVTVMSSIRDKASFQLHLVPENTDEIQRLQLKDMENISNSLVEDMTNMFKSFCNCTAHFHNLTVNCSTSGNLLVRGMIIGAEGNITASLLVDMLQVWLLTSTEVIRVTLSKQSFVINTQCPPRVNSASPDLCDKLHVDVDLQDVDISSRSTSGVIVGGTLVGGMILGFLGCIIVLCIGICILKLKSDWGMRQAAAGSTNTTNTATKEQDVVMDSNAAYETVEMRYQLPAQPQLQARDQRHIEDYSEVVYDCPAS